MKLGESSQLSCVPTSMEILGIWTLDTLLAVLDRNLSAPSTFSGMWQVECTARLIPLLEALATQMPAVVASAGSRPEPAELA